MSDEPLSSLGWERRFAILMLMGAVLMISLTWASEYRSCVRVNGVTEKINAKLASSVGPNRGTRLEQLECFEVLPDTRTPGIQEMRR